MKCCILLAVFATTAAAQVTPPVRDTTRPRPDTTRPRPDTTRMTTLPAMRTEDTRIERQMFDEKPNVGRLSVSAKELSAAPRFFSEADLLRTIQLLPGVEARNDFNAGMNVRGGETDQNLVLLDGYPIYNPFHLGGLFGTFVEPMVGRVDLFTGAFPAPYGNRLSSVLDVRSAEEMRNGLHGTANISLIASQMSLGSAFNGGRGSWMAAGRRTYIDKAVKTLTPEELPYDFQDFQTHLSHSFDNGFRLGVTAYSGHDQFKVVTERFFSDGSGSAQEKETQSFSWGNRVAGTTIGRSFSDSPRLFGLRLGDSAVVEQRLSASTFDAEVNLGSGAFVVHTPVRDYRASGLIAGFTERHTRTLGYEIATQRFRYEANYSLPILPADSQAQRMRSGSLFFDDLWKPSPKLIVDAGLRFDAVSGSGWWGFSPRLSAKYFVTPDVALTAGVGQYVQWIRSLAREDVPIRPLDLWVGSADDWPVSRAHHYVLGSEGWLDRHRGFRVEAFLKTYHDLLEPNPLDDANRTGDEFLFLTGRSYGADVMLRQFQRARFSGWVAYTFAVNTRTRLDGTKFHPGQDRRHDINLVGSWRYTKWTLNSRYNLATGTPYSFVAGSYDRKRYGAGTGRYETDDDTPQFLVPERNGLRLPSTHRLDLSASRTGRIRGVNVTPYLSVVNSTNAKNVFVYIFDYSAQPPARVTLHQLSIVPTLGMSLAW